MKVTPPPPVPQLLLGDWPSSSRTGWNSHAEQVARLVRGAGTGRNFEALLREARTLLELGDAELLRRRLADRRFVRAVVTVWLDHPDLARSTMSDELLAEVGRRGPSRLTTLTLVHLFLRHFDLLNGWREGTFSSLRDLVGVALAVQPERDGRDALEAVRRNDEHLLVATAPRDLALDLASESTDLAEWLRETSLSSFSDTRWAQLTRDEFYLAQIEVADAQTGDHPFLEPITSDVLARQRTEDTDTQGTFFGHRVLAGLTDKDTRKPSTEWLRAVTRIGGDPRMTRTQQWKTWWGPVPERNVQRAVRWMAGVNLTAFLDGIEAYAHSTGNADMSRMLERRKLLLSGLYEQDRVEDVRLVLGHSIKRYITRSTSLDLSDVAGLVGSGKDDTAIIYIDCGDFCLVEGSHNFKIHLFTGGPLHELADRSERKFTQSFLRDDLPPKHESEHGGDSHRSFVHRQGGSWIQHSLDYLRERGVVLDERGLMTASDFSNLQLRRARGW